MSIDNIKERSRILKEYPFNWPILYLGLTEKPIMSADQIFQAMREGEEVRRYGETKMNDKSSRSHTIFR